MLVGCGQHDRASPRFDFAHVDRALQYHADPSEAALRAISRTEAARHLKAHSDWAGYYPVDASALDITRDLVAGEAPSQALIAEVAALIYYAKSRPDLQGECASEAARFLPAGDERPPTLHATWGYDIGVASALGASLNFAHPHFHEDNREIWFYCVHELHHAGIIRSHPFPALGEVDTVGELRDLIRYLTFLEGSAVYAARDMRERMDALESDQDYVALADAARMEKISARYGELLNELDARVGDEALNDADWAIIDEMSGGERLWYRHGAKMAMTIEAKTGAKALRETLAQGPEAFFTAYQAAQAR